MCVCCGGGVGGGGAGLMRACVRLIKRHYDPTCPILTTSCDIRHGKVFPIYRRCSRTSCFQEFSTAHACAEAAKL